MTNSSTTAINHCADCSSPYPREDGCPYCEIVGLREDCKKMQEALEDIYKKDFAELVVWAEAQRCSAEDYPPSRAKEALSELSTNYLNTDES